MFKRQLHENGSCLDDSSLLRDEEENRSMFFKAHRNFKRCYLITKLRPLCNRTILFIVLIVVYSIFIINFYDYFFVQPNFSSKLLKNSYACHDTPSCAARLGVPAYDNVINNKNHSRNAFFSALYTDNYLLGALILGHTIRKYHPNHPMYMLYFEDRLSNDTTLCALRSIGWQMMSVQRIQPIPGVHPKFIDQVRFKKHIAYINTI